MVKNSPNMGTRSITMPNDPRVLPIGRFLRKTKINELPQILNVLIGDMSIVGPRPLVQETFDSYTPEIQAEIYDCKPGLTGLAPSCFATRSLFSRRRICRLQNFIEVAFHRTKVPWNSGISAIEILGLIVI